MQERLTQLSEQFTTEPVFGLHEVGAVLAILLAGRQLNTTQVLVGLAIFGLCATVGFRYWQHPEPSPVVDGVISRFRSDNRAVSPVIGVVLMVAVTVILAAVVGAFVFGLGQASTGAAPNANIHIDGAAGEQVVITHGGGSSVRSVLEVVYTDTNGTEHRETWDASPDNPLTAADSYTTAYRVAGGTEIQVVWTGENGDTAILAGEPVG